MDENVLRKRSRHNALRRYRPADDPEVVDAAVELKYAGGDEYIRKLVSTWPPLSAEQRANLAALLAPSIQDGDADAA